MQTETKEKTKVLVVCAGNFCRSPTGEELIALNEDYEAKSCGLYYGSVVEVSRELVDWANIIVVMEQYMKNHLATFVNPDKIVVLNIPDLYYYGSPQLVNLMTERLLGYGIDVTHVKDRYKPRTEMKMCEKSNHFIWARACNMDCENCWITKDVYKGKRE